jgi:hypothetical protein
MIKQGASPKQGQAEQEHSISGRKGGMHPILLTAAVRKSYSIENKIVTFSVTEELYHSSPKLLARGARAS